MKRLTTDAPKNNLESALNLFYAKDGEAWVLGGGPEPNYVPDTIAMRAIQQISRRAKAQNSPVPALLRRIGVSRELF